MFGIKFGNESDSSFIDIGYLNWDAMMDVSQLVWFPVMNDSYFWQNQITGILFQTSPNTNSSFALQALPAKTDSGTSCVYVPKKYFTSILENIFSNTKYWWNQTDQSYRIDCKDTRKVLPIKLLFGGYWVEMEVKDFIIEYKG